MEREKQRKAVNEVVDLMMLGESVVANFRKEMGAEEEEGGGYNEPLDMKDRLMFAHTLGMMLAHMEQKEAQEKATAVQRDQVERALKADEAAAATQRDQRKVMLDPARTEDEFLELLRLNKISPNTATRVMGAMLNTLEGQKMLQVLLHQAVNGHRQAEGQLGGG